MSDTTEKKRMPEDKEGIILGRVKEVRTGPGINLTQEKFAEAIGVSTNTISRIERGEISLSSDVALKIVGKWRYVNLNYLFGLNPNMETPAHCPCPQLMEAENQIATQTDLAREFYQKLEAIKKVLERTELKIIKSEKPHCSE